MHTKRTKIHEEGKGDDPEVLGVEHPTTVELGKSWGLTPG